MEKFSKSEIIFNIETVLAVLRRDLRNDEDTLYRVEDELRDMFGEEEEEEEED